MRPQGISGAKCTAVQETATPQLAKVGTSSTDFAVAMQYAASGITLQKQSKPHDSQKQTEIDPHTSLEESTLSTTTSATSPMPLLADHPMMATVGAKGRMASVPSENDSKGANIPEDQLNAGQLPPMGSENSIDISQPSLAALSNAQEEKPQTHLSLLNAPEISKKKAEVTDRRATMEKKSRASTLSNEVSCSDIQATKTAPDLSMAGSANEVCISLPQVVSSQAITTASTSSIVRPVIIDSGKRGASITRPTGTPNKSIASEASESAKTSQEATSQETASQSAAPLSASSAKEGTSVAPPVVAISGHDGLTLNTAVVSTASMPTGHTPPGVPVHRSDAFSVAQLPMPLSPETSLPHAMLSATPRTLEVGVANGDQGWLKIRAELTGPGEVKAELTGGSAVAADRLRNELPALSSYLQAEKVSVNSLEIRELPVAPTAIPGTERSTPHEAGFTQTAYGEAGGQPQQQNRQETNHLSTTQEGGIGVGNLFDEASTGGSRSRSVLDSSMDLHAIEFRADGGWLNVRV